MKRNLLFISALFLSLSIPAQTTLYQNDFTGGSAGWQLGQGNAFNFWTVNNVYNCTYPTADQGGGNYMHVYDDLNADYCATYVILGMGSGETVYSTMTSGFSTVGQPQVNIQFDWLCQGQTGPVLSSFGFIEYSTDGGSTWTLMTNPITQYNGQPAWTTQIITSAQEPGLLNQSNLRLRFGFTSSGYGTNPSFAIDNILITGSAITGTNEANEEPAIFMTEQDGVFSIGSVTGSADVTITDIQGREIASLANYLSGTLIDISAQPAGLYLVQLRDRENTWIKKIIIH
ncbi:MAG: T9SS type A sorting domain-containing protein [Bacteroidota bacterium]